MSPHIKNSNIDNNIYIDGPHIFRCIARLSLFLSDGSRLSSRSCLPRAQSRTWQHSENSAGFCPERVFPEFVLQKALSYPPHPQNSEYAIGLWKALAKRRFSSSSSRRRAYCEKAAAASREPSGRADADPAHPGPM